MKPSHTITEHTNGFGAVEWLHAIGAIGCCRLKTKKTIESLHKATWEGRSDIYIYIDLYLYTSEIN